MIPHGKKILLIAAVIVISFFAWTRYLPPEARVTRTLTEAAAAAEVKDVAGFLSYMDDSYLDPYHDDRAALEARVSEAFDRVDRFNITIREIEVDVETDTASATFDLIVVGIKGDQRYLLTGSPIQPRKVTAHLAKKPAGWKVQRLELSPAGAQN